MSSTEVGKLLKQAREKRGLDLLEAAQATRIRSHFLQALEEGDFGALPSSAQVRGFLRTYAEYLELDPKDLFHLLQPAKPEQVEVIESPEASELLTKSDEENKSVFSTLGEKLKARRERLQLTFEEIEKSTRIPSHYLDRLEHGEFDKFPSPSQARGMLSAYAEYLGLESNEMLGQYAEAVQQRFLSKQAEKPTKPKREAPKMVFRMPEWLAPFISRDIVFGGVAGLFLLVFVIWSIGRIAAVATGETPEPTAPPIIGLLIPSEGTPIDSTLPAGTEESINLLAQGTQTPALLGEATIQAGAFGNIAVRLIATQRTWMRVTVDGRVEFEGRTMPGESYTFTAANQIALLTGNGSALRAFLNEQDLGILGFFGQVVDVVFTAQGAATPTLSPTPTINPDILTATAESALTPSVTPTATATPSPEVTISP